MSQLLPCLKDMQANSWSMIVFWNETKGSVVRTGPDVGLDFTDQPAPAPDMPPQPPAGEDEAGHPGYDDPHDDMPVDDEDMPPPQGQHPEPDLDDDPIELDTGGDPPSQPPGGGTQVPVPGGEHDDSDLDMPMDSEDTGGNPPPGGGPQRPEPVTGSRTSLPRRLGMVSVWLRSARQITIRAFFIWILRLPSFKGNTTFCHLAWLRFSCLRTSAFRLGWSVFAFVRFMV